MKILCIVSILWVFTNGEDTYPCYEATDQYWYLSTRTTYESVSSKKIELPDSCTPVKLFMVIRYGTSNINNHFKEGYLWRIDPYRNKITENAKMCQTDIEAIRNWKSIFERNENSTSMTKNGREEIKELALRIKNLFPNIFSKPQNSDNYNIIIIVLVMSNERCKETGEIFLQTFFGRTDIDHLKTEDTDKMNKKLSNILYTMNALDKYYSEESNTFWKSDTLKNVLKRVADKMGINPEDIKLPIVQVMYYICSYERSVEEKLIPAWCRVFCQEDLKVIEYYEELYWYYAIGYGNDMNRQWACPMALRLLDSFKTSFFSSDRGPYGTFNFTSHEFVLGIYVLLGIGENEDDSKIIMDSSNYDYMKDRKWRISLFSPWAANVTAVFFKCRYHLLTPTEYKVAFYFNENIVDVPLKNGTTCKVCLWPIIEEKIQTFIHKNKCRAYLNTEKKKQSIPTNE